jgi:hypothetical protein
MLRFWFSAGNGSSFIFMILLAKELPSPRNPAGLMFVFKAAIRTISVRVNEEGNRHPHGV